MRLPYKIILAIAFGFTIYIAWHDSKYDKPSVPYTLRQTLVELTIMIPLTTAIIFGFLSGIYYTLFEDWKTRRRT